MTDDDAVRRLTDAAGRVLRWPKKAADKALCLACLAERFEPGVRHTEREVNERLDAWTVDGDCALWRRELVVKGLLARTPDGRAYWRVAGSDARPEG